MADSQHVLSAVDFNGEPLSIQDAEARQNVANLQAALTEFTKTVVTGVAEGMSDYTVRVTKEGLAIDIPVHGLANKISELEKAIADAKTDVSLDSPSFTGKPTAPTANASDSSTQIANTAFVQSELAGHNTSSTSHEDIRRILTQLSEKLDSIGNSEDVDLSDLNEIVAYIKENRASIESLTESKVNVSDIVNDLVSDAVDKPLSAKQGNTLKGFIDTILSSISEVDNTSDVNKPVSTAQQTAIDTAYANSNKYTDQKIAELIDGAPETMDTLKEVADAIAENKDVEEALNTAIGTKANQSELDTHTGNTTIHITASERTNWNAAKTHADSAHARTDATKVEKSTKNGNIKINGTETNVYTHPSGTNPHGTTKDDVGLGNVGNYKAVSTVASQGLSDEEKAAARDNIGAQASGDYSVSGHNHDDRYYTESEIDIKLGTKVDLSADGVSKAINQLSTGTSAPTDDDYYLSQYAGGGTTTTTYHRRPMSALWNYIKGKADKVYSAIEHKHTKSEITDFPTSMPADGGDADTVNGHTVNANVPSDAEFTDTVYTHPTSSGNKHIPSGGSSGQILRWSADGTAVWGDEAQSSGGTITGIKMNGTSKGTSGVVDLGTVLTGGKQSSTSTADSGSNVYTFSDGSTITVKNGSKGSPGADGDSVTVSEVSESSIDSGSNVVSFSDGTKLTVKNGSKGSKGDDGTSVTISSISQSSVDGGSNVITFSDGKTLSIKNGSKGNDGSQGVIKSTTAPSDTSKVWLDSNTGILKYYTNSAWTPVVSTWG